MSWALHANASLRPPSADIMGKECGGLCSAVDARSPTGPHEMQGTRQSHGAHQCTSLPADVLEFQHLCVCVCVHVKEREYVYEICMREYLCVYISVLMCVVCLCECA